MDEETLKIMPEFVNKLPQSIQEVIFDGVWEERTDEIAKKYSLDPTQTDNLINNVLFVLIGLENPDEFLETIIFELNVSRLLAEQIIEDLEIRVFEYAVKSIKKKEEKTFSDENKIEESEVKQEQTGVLPKIKPEVLPELEPDILPMIEKGGVAHDVKPKEISNFQFSVSNETQNPNDKIAQEQIQKPISVPRFTAEPPNETPKPTQQTPAQEKRYAVDPYREPIE